MVDSGIRTWTLPTLFAHPASSCNPSVILQGSLVAVLAGGLACSSATGANENAPPLAGADSASTCGLGRASPTCGDPCSEGVVIAADVTESTTWDCPVYTLAAPVYVRGDVGETARLVIAPGTIVKGRSGNLDEGRLPGSLIVTRSGHLEARGTRSDPIVFTSARPPGERAPGDWGGVVLLGSAATNVPADYDGSGNRAGEMFIEGLPRSADTTYGSSADVDAPVPPNPEHDCGTLRFVRIEFAGFEVGDTNELNGLTVGACGRGTVLDFIQVHLGSDDGVEFFGGSADLKHAVITGAKDDSLDWDQGWTGRVQFLAIRQFESDGDTEQSDNAFEGDGYADPEQPTGEASAPLMYNVTVLVSGQAQRGIRLREGTWLGLSDAMVLSLAGGPLAGLIEVDDTFTADELAAGNIVANHTIFQGAWPIDVQADSNGTTTLTEDHFTVGMGSAGNTVLSREQALTLLPAAMDSQSGWMPVRGSHASRGWVVPSSGSDEEVAPFFDSGATYRGAFDPSGEDWTLGWTAYPLR